MPRLSGTAGSGLGGARIPIRVEDPDTGALLGTTVTDRDGTWTVEVPHAGRVVVAERGGRRYETHTGHDEDPRDGGVPVVGVRHQRRVAALRTEGR